MFPHYDASAKSTNSQMNDIQYLHLLLGDEKTARLNLHDDVRKVTQSLANVTARVDQMANSHFAQNMIFNDYKADTDELISGLTATLQDEEMKLWNMSLARRKPVFGVCDQGRLKPACPGTETS